MNALDEAIDDSDGLARRILELEEEQESAKQRIEQLTQAKLSVEIALARLQAQQQKTDHERNNNERLQAELTNLLKKREDEQLQLTNKIEDLRVRARHDIALLKAERDAALALIEKQQSEGDPNNSSNSANKWIEYIAVSLLTGIVLMTILILFF